MSCTTPVSYLLPYRGLFSDADLHSVPDGQLPSVARATSNGMKNASLAEI